MEHALFELGVKAFIRNTDGDVLLLYKNPVAMGKVSLPNHWDLPGGRVHQGERIEQALKREMKEEMGVARVRVGRFVTAAISRLFHRKDNVGLILFIYECSLPDRIVIRLDEEHTQFGWVPIQKVGKLLSIKYPKDCIRMLLGEFL